MHRFLGSTAAISAIAVLVTFAMLGSTRSGGLSPPDPLPDPTDCECHTRCWVFACSNFDTWPCRPDEELATLCKKDTIIPSTQEPWDYYFLSKSAKCVFKKDEEAACLVLSTAVITSICEIQGVQADDEGPECDPGKGRCYLTQPGPGDDDTELTYLSVEQSNSTQCPASPRDPGKYDCNDADASGQSCAYCHGTP